MDNEILISSAISLAAIVVSAAQIYVAHLNKTKEIKIAKDSNDREWKRDMAEFVLKHTDEIFCKDPEKQARIRDIITLAFPPELSIILFDQINSLVLSELLSPVVVNLNRSREAFQRWTGKNLYLEAKVIRECNVKIRDTLVEKAHLIPGYLMDDASRLISHLDAWLEEFDKVRDDQELSDATPFVFVGPNGHPFPMASEARFIEAFNNMRGEERTHNKAIDSD